MRQPRALEDRVRIALLRSDRVLGALLEALSGDERPLDLRRDVDDTVTAGDAYAFRRGDVDVALKRYFQPASGSEPNGLYSLEILRELAEEYLFMDGDRLTVLPERLDRYLELIAHVEPAFLIGALLARALGRGEVSIDSLDFLLDRQDPLALPRFPAGNIHADNHVHFGGVSSTAHALFTVATDGARIDRKRHMPERFRQLLTPRFRRPEVVLPAAYAKLFGAVAVHATGAADPWPDLAADLYPLLDHGLIMGSLTPPSLRAIDECFGARSDTLEQRLMAMMARRARDGDNAAAFILFATLLCRLDEACDDRQIRLATLAFVHLTHELRGTMIMAGVGLETFIQYFHAPLHQFRTKAHQMRLLIGNPNCRAEIKVTPGTPSWLRQLADTAANAGREGDEPHPWRRYHLCYHFVRDGHGKAGRQGRHQERRSKMRREAADVSRGLRAVVRHDAAELVQDLTSRVRGFDVAGDENGTPIEVFAPALRWLRERPMPQADSTERLAARRSLSIHAGEDFDHLVSGLRHIDETVQFCNMGAGDRLGHALALGLKPAVWAGRQGTAHVTLERHFDNLVWLWHYATMLSGRLPVAATAVPLLARRVEFYAGQLDLPRLDERDRSRADFNSARLGQSLDTYYRAWRLRRNCAIGITRWRNETDARYWVPDLAETPNLETRPEFHLYRDYLSSRFERAAGRTVAVVLNMDGPPTDDEDHFSPAELDLVEAVQDHLMTDYDRRGIVIEVCPSSNLHISRIDHYDEHPCFRWHPPTEALLAARYNRFGLRTGPVRVCVNSDDPGVFPTNIVAEHFVLRMVACKEFGLSQTEADIWVDSLRRSGVALFDQAHADVRYERRRDDDRAPAAIPRR
ncbi:MAG: hypothetical protein HQL39_08675 [Alphaproteobacteria bacterium]|nr:hypothetical protein [Alphaproteobacteria bacterium]